MTQDIELSADKYVQHISRKIMGCNILAQYSSNIWEFKCHINWSSSNTETGRSEIHFRRGQTNVKTRPKVAIASFNEHGRKMAKSYFVRKLLQCEPRYLHV